LVAGAQGQAPTKESILGALGIDGSLWDITGETVEVIEKERVVRYECRLEKKQP